MSTLVSQHLANGWQAVIGIEVHAQLNTTTKLFSDSPTSFNDHVNTQISTIDCAFPGVQPRLNGHCVELAVKTALALGAHVQKHSLFDRKHYFYPDLPQGYQITQHNAPIAYGGSIRLTELDGLSQPMDIGIIQIQLEQDTGKSLHDATPGCTLLDLNRAGIGLMEIVTKPDIRSSIEAGILVKKLQAILRCVGSSKANMDEGSMRCDVNVSVHKQDEPFGTRCELKNLNSVRFLMMAIEAEIQRQIELIEQGKSVLSETRGYDVVKNKTFKLRGKETAPDYRYMPEPDLPPLLLDQKYIDKIARTLPELPDQTRERIMAQYNITLHDATVLLNEPGSLDFFENVCKGRNSKIVVNWLLHELFGQLASRDIPFMDNPLSHDQLGNLIDLVQDGTITGRTGKKVLRLLLEDSRRNPLDIIKERGWIRVTDVQALRKWCEEVIREYPDMAESIRNGNQKPFQWFVGQAMKKSKGKADPSRLNTVLRDLLK